MIASTGFAVLTPRMVPWSFLYAALTRPEISEYFGQHADGGAYPAIRPEIIGRMNLALPQDRGVLEEFHRTAASLFELAETHRRSSRTLAALRDLLLPKLMTGELRVGDRAGFQ
jgi:type I restriction enzyme S subunit